MFHPPLVASYSELVSVPGEKTLLPVGVDDQGNVYVNVVNNPFGVTIANTPLPTTLVPTVLITPLAVSTVITAGAAGSVTLPGAALNTTFIRGFTLTSRSPAGIITNPITITGPTNALNYLYTMDKSGQNILNVYFGETGIAASAPNTPIVVTFPVLSGTSQTALTAWGYQQGPMPL